MTWKSNKCEILSNWRNLTVPPHHLYSLCSIWLLFQLSPWGCCTFITRECLFLLFFEGSWWGRKLRIYVCTHYTTCKKKCGHTYTHTGGGIKCDAKGAVSLAGHRDIWLQIYCRGLDGVLILPLRFYPNCYRQLLQCKGLILLGYCCTCRNK